jgi:hypothetical protein
MMEAGMMSSMTKVLAGFLVGALMVSLGVFGRGPLTFEERVKAQEAIERVYYNHRIWPKENPGPKPPFEQMMPREQIEAKVNDYLRMCAALDQFWQRPIQASQLQAEMNRMAEKTKDPGTLRELFAALNNDPALIAECLARPILADRLIRNWYANDERFHGETKAKAKAALASVCGGSLSICNEGNYQKVAYVLSNGEENAFAPDRKGHGEIALDAKHFQEEFQQIPNEGMPAVLRETEEAFLLVRTVIKAQARVEIETLAFPKRDIEEWVKTVELSGPTEEAAPVGFAFAIPPTPETNCTGDTWAPTSTGTNCPSARYGHTAVWTGAEMIVWGGYYYDTSSHFLNDGARYYLSTDSWTPTSTGVNCPSGRELHTAIWTGSKMIVWGAIVVVAISTRVGSMIQPMTFGHLLLLGITSLHPVVGIRPSGQA